MGFWGFVVRTTYKRRLDEMENDYKEKLKSKFEEEEKNVFRDEIEQLKGTAEKFNEVKEINFEQTVKLKELFNARIIDENMQIIH